MQPKKEIPPEEPVEATRIDDGAGIPVGRSSGSTPLTQTPYPDDTRRWKPSAPQEPFAAQRPQHAPAPPPAAGIVIPVYSPAAQGPDLNQLYNALVAALKSSQDNAITFDLAYIQTMSDAELEYLEKIRWSLTGQNRTLSLINCAPSLALALKRHPQLGALVR
jgi:hypothetical protein